MSYPKRLKRCLAKAPSGTKTGFFPILPGFAPTNSNVDIICSLRWFCKPLESNLGSKAQFGSASFLSPDFLKIVGEITQDLVSWPSPCKNNDVTTTPMFKYLPISSVYAHL